MQIEVLRPPTFATLKTVLADRVLGGVRQVDVARLDARQLVNEVTHPQCTVVFR
ncbi:MAG: hypothetical protein AAGB04_26095 [Pseudomonadota bacterium]